MQTTYILHKIEHSKPIQDLTDKIAGRAYTMDKIEDVTATQIVTLIDGEVAEVDFQISRTSA